MEEAAKEMDAQSSLATTSSHDVNATHSAAHLRER
jgi:hypothetical protein